MKLKGQIQGLTKDVYNSVFLLTIALKDNIGDEVNDYRGKDLNIDITVYRQKRSKDANAYMWKICALISEKILIPSVQIYRDAIRNVGVYEDWQLPVDKETRFKELWERNGIGWLAERVDYDAQGKQLIVRAYRGSSTYDAAQMARLIDWLSEDAKELGITLLSDREKSLLLDNWEAKKC